MGMLYPDLSQLLPPWSWRLLRSLDLTNIAHQMDGAPLIDWRSRLQDYKQRLVPLEQVLPAQNVVGVDSTLHFLLSAHLLHGRQGLLLEESCPQRQIDLATKLLAASRRTFQSL